MKENYLKKYLSIIIFIILVGILGILVNIDYFAYGIETKNIITIFFEEKIVIYLIYIINIYLLIKILKYLKVLKMVNLKKQYEIDLEYYREVPKIAKSVEEISYLYYFNKNISKEIDTIKSRMIIAIIISLRQKELINFLEINENLFIKVNKIKKQELSRSETRIYKILEKIKDENDYLSLKELGLYMIERENTIGIIDKIFQEDGRNGLLKKGLLDEKKEKKLNGYKSLLDINIKSLVVLIFGVMIANSMALLITLILIGIMIIELILITNRFPVLTNLGQYEKEKLEALGDYLNEYSLMKEKDIFESKLNEEYLIYSVIFGISKEIIKSLKVVAPKIAREGSKHLMGYEDSNKMTIVDLLNALDNITKI